MAVTQYIGARYVPKFYENSDNTSDWRSGVVYEPLTIVTYNGNSYTSKKPVPATVGNPSANLEYWAPTGIYNEQVESLRQEFEELKETTETAVSDMLPKKGYQKAVLLSDSYGVNNVTGGTSWIQHMLNNYSSRIAFAYAWGGAGFGYQPAETGYFPSFLSTLDENYDADVVIFLCGANDGNLVYLGRATEQNIYNGLLASMDILKNKYPNARIKLGFVGRYKDVNRYESYKRACEVYKAYANELGYEYIDNSQYALHNTSLIDGADIHPNAQGSLKLSKVAICALENRRYNVYERYQYANYYVEVNNDVTILHYVGTTDFTAVAPDVNEVTPLRTIVPFTNFCHIGNIFQPVGILEGPAGCAVGVSGASVPAVITWHGTNTGIGAVTFVNINNEMTVKTIGNCYFTKYFTLKSDTMLC